MSISIIVALSENNAIGVNNDLPWHLSDDLKHFKQLTKGHTVIMGRKTWNSLPRKPLPLRRNIVLSTDPAFLPEGAEVARSVEAVVNKIAADEEAFVMGGATLYRQFLPLADRLYFTRVYTTIDADVYFPEVDLSHYQMVQESELFTDDSSQLTFRYLDYVRVNEK